jgi:WD40 repeat protein
MSIVQGPVDRALLIFDPTKPVSGQQLERVAPHPSGIFFPRAWSPDGHKLAGTIANTVTVLDRRDGRYTLVAEATRVVAGGEIAWLPDSRRLVTMLDGQTVILVDTATRAVRTIYSSVPDGVRSFGLSPAGTEFYVSRGPDEADVWIATIESR